MVYLLIAAYLSISTALNSLSIGIKVTLADNQAACPGSSQQHDGTSSQCTVKKTIHKFTFNLAVATHNSELFKEVTFTIKETIINFFYGLVLQLCQHRKISTRDLTHQYPTGQYMKVRCR